MKKLSLSILKYQKKGMIENPPPLMPESRKGKRGRPKQSKVKNLLDRFIKFKEEIFRFTTDLRVSFENNQAERDLRMVRVQQKISGTFRIPQGADAFCRNRGYISTIMKNMISVMTRFLQRLKVTHHYLTDYFFYLQAEFLLFYY